MTTVTTATTIGRQARSGTRPENAKSLALDIPLGEIISRATRGNKKGQRARMEVRENEGRKETERRARKFLYGDYGGGRGIIASIISAGCTRPLFLGRLPLLLFLSSSPPIYLRRSGLSLSLPHPLFYFRLDVSARAKAPGCVATNDEGFIGDGKGERGAGVGGGGPGLLPVP